MITCYDYILLSKYYLARWFIRRTIRKVMGGGGEFLSRRNFFSLSNSLYEFFLGRRMNMF